MFTTSFLVLPLFAGVFIALMAGVLSPLLLQKRLALLSDGITHVAFAGIALGLVLSVPPLLVAGALAIIASYVLIGKHSLSGEVATALLLTAGVAIAVLTLSLATSLNTSILSYLFGSIFLVTTTEVVLAGVASLATSILFINYRDRILLWMFNEEIALTKDVPVRYLQIGLATVSAVLIVFTIRLVGILLTTGIFVFPGLLGLAVGRSFKGVLIASIAFSLFAVSVGIIASYVTNLPASAVIITVFFLVYGFMKTFERLS